MRRRVLQAKNCLPAVSYYHSAQRRWIRWLPTPPPPPQFWLLLFFLFISFLLYFNFCWSDTVYQILCVGQLQKSKVPDPGGSKQQICIGDKNDIAMLSIVAFFFPVHVILILIKNKTQTAATNIKPLLHSFVFMLMFSNKNTFEICSS